MGRLGVGREQLGGILRSYGEDDLAKRALHCSDEELKRIQELAFDYAF
jgi:hypothetical protein